jgi:uncharacterized protein YicC (UPF0701 family)
MPMTTPELQAIQERCEKARFNLPTDYRREHFPLRQALTDCESLLSEIARLQQEVVMWNEKLDTAEERIVELEQAHERLSLLHNTVTDVTLPTVTP